MSIVENNQGMGKKARWPAARRKRIAFASRYVMIDDLETCATADQLFPVLNLGGKKEGDGPA
mgnify:CR=1 FL=1